MPNSTTDRPAIATTRTYCDYSELTPRDRTTIARFPGWNMCADVQAQEAIRIAITNNIVQLKLTSGRAALLAVNTFKLILKQQRQQPDEDAAIVEQLEQTLGKGSKKIEIAKNYLLGQQVQLLGTAYPVGRDWNSQVVNGKPSLGVRTATTDEENEVAA